MGRDFSADVDWLPLTGKLGRGADVLEAAARPPTGSAGCDTAAAVRVDVGGCLLLPAPSVLIGNT